MLNGVGVDGVGGIFPFFSFFFAFFSFFFAFQDKSKQLQFTGKMGNFTPTPSAPTPFRTSRNLLGAKQKRTEEQTHEQKFHGTVPGFAGELFAYVLFSSIWNEARKTHKFWPPTQSRDNSPNLFMFICCASCGLIFLETLTWKP